MSSFRTENKPKSVSPHSGVHFVKINDKKISKQYNVKTYPALTYFRNKEPIAYEGIAGFQPLRALSVALLSRINQFAWVGCVDVLQAICWMKSKFWNS